MAVIGSTAVKKRANGGPVEVKGYNDLKILIRQTEE
jgi:hypothetical protein